MKVKYVMRFRNISFVYLISDPFLCDTIELYSKYRF